MKDWTQNKQKNGEALLEAINTECLVDGCNHHITAFYGPGHQSLCLDHQIMLSEYGGPGYINRSYTFHKKEVCENCGYDPFNDPELLDIDDKDHRIKSMWAMLQCDHIEKKRHGHDGVNRKENIKTLCPNCHTKKTMINKDYL